MWKAISGIFKRNRTTQILALAGLDSASAEGLTNAELKDLEGLCHDLIEGASTEDGGMAVLVASERGIGVNPGLCSPAPWGFRLLVTPEGIVAKGDD